MSFKWLLVSWESDGGFSVVNSRSIAGISVMEVTEGDSIQVFQKRGVVCQAKVVRMSNDKKALERDMVKLKQTKVEAPTPEEAPAPLLYEDPAAAAGDFSPSDSSSWGPESHASSDSEGHAVNEVQQLIINTSRQYTNNKSKKIHRTPTLRAEPVIPISNINGRNHHIENGNQNNKVNKEDNSVSIPAEEIAMVKQEITNLRTMLGTLKLALSDILRDKPTTNHLYDTKTASFTYDISPKPTASNNDDRNTSTQTNNIEENTNSNTKNEHIRPLKYGMIRHNSSKGNAVNGSRKVVVTSDTIFTPKPPLFLKSYGKRVIVKTPNSPKQVKEEAAFNGMIPIGSGKTFVTKRIYDQIDWNSYTMATRKLLMAVFPRKTLATHSLTGKASPAFADRPAKLCLDQKKIQDIILTVIEKCKVKECLVRSAITTKCADEYRMYRMKMAKDKKTRNGPFRLLNGRDLDSPGIQQTDPENQVI